jgi:hypothetical protein
VRRGVEESENDISMRDCRGKEEKQAYVVPLIIVSDDSRVSDKDSSSLDRAPYTRCDVVSTRSGQGRDGDRLEESPHLPEQASAPPRARTKG